MTRKGPKGVGPKGCTTVYFVRVGEYVKIGATSNLYNRMSVFQTSSPYELTVLGTLENIDNLEGKLHKKYLEYHHRGEWFHLPHDHMIEELTPSSSDTCYTSRPRLQNDSKQWDLPLE